MDRELEFALIAGKSALILAADAAGPDSIAGDRCRKSATVIQGHIDALSTPPAPDAVKRYDISLTAGEVHECRTGFWMHASDYESLARQVAGLRGVLVSARRALFDHGDMRYIASTVEQIDKALAGDPP